MHYKLSCAFSGSCFCSIFCCCLFQVGYLYSFQASAWAVSDWKPSNLYKALNQWLFYYEWTPRVYGEYIIGSPHSQQLEAGLLSRPSKEQIVQVTISVSPNKTISNRVVPREKPLRLISAIFVPRRTAVVHSNESLWKISNNLFE